MKDIGGVGMISFIICLALLIGGYFVYGKVAENTFAPDDRETPSLIRTAGVSLSSGAKVFSTTLPETKDPPVSSAKQMIKLIIPTPPVSFIS